jgi:glucokinase
VRAVGLAVTGIVDERRGMAVHSQNVGWRNVPVRSLVEQATGLPVGFGHDVRAGTLAEWRLGAGRGLEDLVFVAIGTGVSAGIIVQGRPLVGGGYAGEIGHVDVGHGEPCTCGGRGCVEAVASAAAIARRYAAASGRPVPGARDVAERLAAGDPAARRVWTDATEALALALAWTSVVVAPQAILLGGGLARSGSLLFEPVRQALHRHLAWSGGRGCCPPPCGMRPASSAPPCWPGRCSTTGGRHDPHRHPQRRARHHLPGRPAHSGIEPSRAERRGAGRW